MHGWDIWLRAADKMAREKAEVAEELERQEQERRDQQTSLRTQLEEDRCCMQAAGIKIVLDPNAGSSRRVGWCRCLIV